MRFLKDKNGTYITTFISGPQHNILGVCFDDFDLNETKVLELPVKEGAKKYTSKEQVLGQVLAGLKEVNESQNTSYKLSKIYFLPSDRPTYSIYRLLICKIVRRYHAKKEFKTIAKEFGTIAVNEE